jgi:hypothetical protein
MEERHQNTVPCPNTWSALFRALLDKLIAAGIRISNVELRELEILTEAAE